MLRLYDSAQTTNQCKNMPGIRAKKKRQTRQAILQAAVRLFTRKGYEKTSITELARAAGIGKGTIYSYFATKQEIFLAFCEEEIEFAFARLSEQTDPDAPLLDQMMTLAMAQFDFVTRNREFGRIYARETAFPREQTAARCRELDSSYLRRVAAILERARQRGELRIDTHLLLAVAHFHALYMLALSAWYSGYAETREEMAGFLRELVLQAIGGLAAQPLPLDRNLELLGKFTRLFQETGEPFSDPSAETGRSNPDRPRDH